MEARKLKKMCLRGGIALAALLFATVLKAQPAGQWDFDNGALTGTVGGDLTYADGAGGATQQGTSFGTTTSLSIPALPGGTANVMKFPGANASVGYYMPVPPVANGGGSLLNDYTIIFEVLYPTGSDSKTRPLIQTDDGSQTGHKTAIGILPGNGIGVIGGTPHGVVLPNVWYRIAFVMDTASGYIHEYINGAEVGTDSLGLADGSYALVGSSFNLLFSNSDTNSAPGYVNSIQIRTTALNPGQVLALGTPSASGIAATIPPVPSFIQTRSPGVGDVNVNPQPAINVVLNRGDTTVTVGSVALLIDGAPVAATITPSGDTTTIAYTPPVLFGPSSPHDLSLVYVDSVVGLQTNTWTFTVTAYENITLPTPIYLETFDELTEGTLPPGWTVTNNTVHQTAGYDLSDPSSDAYLDWVVISSNRFSTVFNQRRLQLPTIVLNGQVVDRLVHGNLAYCDSDQRQNAGGQVNVMFTSDYDLTGKTNVFLAFKSTYEQNQDNIGSVEYSIDQGQTWLPALYLLDNGVTDGDGSDVVTNNGVIDVFKTFGTARSDQAYGLAYSNYIGAVVSTNLIPFIQGRNNDDPLDSKRIEVIRLAKADNQAKVRFRFGQAGTSSWYFGIDDMGLYSINTPVISAQPVAQTVDAATPVTFSVTASGNPPLKYQWQFKSKNIAGATNSTYTIASVAPTDAGLYQVIVSNSDGPVTSNPAALTVITKPQIVTQPVGATVSPGSTVTLSASARGGQPISYNWLLNGKLILNVPLTPNLVLTNIQPTNGGAYQLVVLNGYGAVTSAVAQVVVFTAPITNGLVTHLTFDGNYNDTSGSGANGSAVGAPTFQTGKIGQAVHIISNGDSSTNNYVTLGYPSVLKFGSAATSDATDFSFSFWTLVNSQNDDKPFISNKNWDSGSNLGFVLASEGGGMKWNFVDDGGSGRRDSASVFPQLLDHTWHHVVVTFQRTALANIYMDGVLVNSTSDAPAAGFPIGSVDTDGAGMNINLGQDGRGTYTDGGNGAAIDMLMDDLGIWRRVLTPQEVAGIYAQGLAGKDLTTATGQPVVLAPTISTQPVGAVVSVGANVTLTVVAAGTAPYTYQWSKGGTAISGATSATLTLSAVQASGAGDYTVAVSNAGGSVTSAVAHVTVFTGAITDSLVAHLKFDGNYTDATANAVNGSPIGTGTAETSGPVFETGILGQAVHTRSSSDGLTNDYVSLGFPSVLQFAGGTNGSPSDFSVAFWIKIFSSTADMTFIGDEDWDSSSNLGWSLDVEDDGMKWNFKDSQNSKRNSAHIAPQLRDHNWHHLVVTFQRTGAGVTYLDGAAIDTTSIAPSGTNGVGNIDTIGLTPPTATARPFAVNLGEDATGVYNVRDTAALDALFDDLGIWRRVITAQEVAAIYAAGNAGKDLSQAGGTVSGIGKVSVSVSGKSLTFTWTAGSTVRLQSTTTLAPANWQDVANTVGQGSATIPIGGASAYYRLFQP